MLNYVILQERVNMPNPYKQEVAQIIREYDIKLLTLTQAVDKIHELYVYSHILDCNNGEDEL
jgi:hypothetical protein